MGSCNTTSHEERRGNEEKVLGSGTRVGKKFIMDYKEVLGTFTKTVNGLICTGSSDSRIEELLSYVTQLIEKRRYGIRSFELLHEVYSLDHDTFVHSLNVALISHEIAGWMGMSKNEQELATLCGLLHDVGKLMVDSNILKKPGMLTPEEREQIQQHPAKGFELLLKSQSVGVHVRNAALMHHERYDGSGYPYGLIGTQIDRYARIVAIADVYDAMTAERIYRSAIAPGDVLRYMKKEYLKYDPEIFSVFLRCAAERVVA